MKKTDLIVGETYILKTFKTIGVYRGERPNGYATIETEYGRRRLWVPAALEFDATNTGTGETYMALFNTAADVEEPLVVREKRERLEAERAAERERNRAYMVELLTKVGLAPEGEGYSATPRVRADHDWARCEVDSIPWARLEPVLKLAARQDV